MIPAIAGAIGPLGPAEWTVGGVGGIGIGGAQGGIGSPGAAGGIDPTGGAGASGSFGGALTNAIQSLDQTQQTASQAAQGLATGTVSDPTQAITAVENAQLSMQLAANLRNKLTEATNTIFQTQI